jgi:hypothetical protein
MSIVQGLTLQKGFPGIPKLQSLPRALQLDNALSLLQVCPGGTEVNHSAYNP